MSGAAGIRLPESSASDSAQSHASEAVDLTPLDGEHAVEPLLDQFLGDLALFAEDPPAARTDVVRAESASCIASRRSVGARPTGLAPRSGSTRGAGGRRTAQRAGQ